MIESQSKYYSFCIRVNGDLMQRILVFATSLLLLGLIYFLPTVLLADDKAFWVTGDGVGTSEDDSKKAALRDAIEKYLGVYISGKTVVEKSQLISNEILAYSNGYIESFDVLQISKEDNLVHVKVIANIRQEQLITKLSKIGCVEISGETYALNAMLAIERRKVSLKIIDDIFKKTITSGFKYEITTPEFVSDIEDEKFVPFSIRVSCIPQYDVWNTFEKVLRKFEVNDSKYKFTWDTLINPYGYKFEFASEGSLAIQPAQDLSRAPSVPITSSAYGLLQEGLMKTSLFVDFFDASDSLIVSKRINLFVVESWYTLAWSLLYITPNGLCKRDNGFSVKIKFISIPLEAIKRTKTIKAMLRSE